MNGLLGSRIKELRCANNFTQEQISSQIGMSRQRYARIENGLSDITLEILTKLANALNVTVSDITQVLDAAPEVQYRSGMNRQSSQKMFDMLDLFYANKHMYDRLKGNAEI